MATTNIMVATQTVIIIQLKLASKLFYKIEESPPFPNRAADSETWLDVGRRYQASSFGFFWDGWALTNADLSKNAETWSFY